MRLIALEEAFALPELTQRYPSTADLAAAAAHVRPDVGRRWGEQLIDFTGERLADMDAHGVDVQVLSLTAPGVQGDGLSTGDAVDAARLANDRLAEVVAANPGRFAGFAALPMQDPARAVDELRRAVTGLGFPGALVNDATDGRYLDDPAYEQFWAALEELGVPLYLHPGMPGTPQWGPLADVPELTGALFSWAGQAGAHALRVLFAGVFDRHPGVRLVLGHLGEFLPFMRWRLDSRYATLAPGRSIERPPSSYLGTNILITTSGVQAPAALAGAIGEIGADAIMFAIDYPFEDTAKSTADFAAAGIGDEDRAKIAHGNAERLLRL